MREAIEEHSIEGELLVVGDGAQAIRYIQSLGTPPFDCPDLIIIDLNLPKKSGREVLQSMRQSAECRDTAAVVLTSSDAKQDKEASMNLGASRYVRKPLLLEEFLGLGAIFKALLEGSGEKNGL